MHPVLNVYVFAAVSTRRDIVKVPVLRVMLLDKVNTQDPVVFVPELVTVNVDPLFDIVNVVFKVRVSLPPNEAFPPLTVIACAF